MALEDLTGFTVGVTADRRSGEQIELLQRRGATVVHGRCIETLPLAGEAGVRDASEALMAEPPEILVLSTSIGVRAWLEAAESLGFGNELLDALAGARVFARGPKAAGAALTAGLDVEWRAPEATNDEVVQRLAEEAELVARTGAGLPRVAVQLDGSPESPHRHSIADRVEAMGFDVVSVPVYLWKLPDDLAGARRLQEQLLAGSLDAITFTAAHTVSNFFTIADGDGREQEVRDALSDPDLAIVCVGPVCAQRCRELGIPGDQIVVPERFRLGAMVRAFVLQFVQRQRSLRMAGVDVRLQGRTAFVNGSEIVSLTARESGVLSRLAARPGAVVSKGDLLSEVWGERADGDPHVVEVTVNRLRSRLGPAGDGIETVVRRGYRISED